MNNHYVYYSYEEWGRGYIGSRSCSCLPEEDISYFGSYTDKTFKPTNKTILCVFNTRKEATAAEALLHKFYDIGTNPHFANKAKQTANGFSFIGKGYKWWTNGKERTRFPTSPGEGWSRVIPESYGIVRLKTPTWEDLKAYQAEAGLRTLDEAIRELLRSQVQHQTSDRSRH